jgi:hypothetical protein
MARSWPRCGRGDVAELLGPLTTAPDPTGASAPTIGSWCWPTSAATTRRGIRRLVAVAPRSGDQTTPGPTSIAIPSLGRRRARVGLRLGGRRRDPDHTTGAGPERGVSRRSPARDHPDCPPCCRASERELVLDKPVVLFEGCSDRGGTPSRGTPRMTDASRTASDVPRAPHGRAAPRRSPPGPS